MRGYDLADWEPFFNVIVAAAAALTGVSLAAEWGGGLYWLAVAALLGIVGAAYNAWVLLVEIVR